ncbi:unnamed protein product, partial [Rotaria socialis]
QSRIRTHMEDRETSERKTDNLYKKLQELFSQLSVTLGTDYGQPTTATFDKVMSRVIAAIQFSSTVRLITENSYVDRSRICHPLIPMFLTSLSCIIPNSQNCES